MFYFNRCKGKRRSSPTSPSRRRPNAWVSREKQTGSSGRRCPNICSRASEEWARRTGDRLCPGNTWTYTRRIQAVCKHVTNVFKVLFSAVKLKYMFVLWSLRFTQVSEVSPTCFSKRGDLGDKHISSYLIKYVFIMWSFVFYCVLYLRLK